MRIPRDQNEEEYMKKLVTLLLAAGLIMGSFSTAKAVDFKLSGWWWMAYDYAYGGNFMSKDRNGKKLASSRQQGPHLAKDNFEAWNRLMFKLDAVASESLSGTLMFEIGDQMWGEAASGGALGADGTVVEVKNAYIDWIVPQTALKLRMGIQGIVMPSFTFENNVLIDDVAAVTASYKFNDTVSLTAFWARPYNDNYTRDAGKGLHNATNLNDNMDVFAFMLPMRFEGIHVTPWAMVAGVGPNVAALTSSNTHTISTNPPMINAQAGQSWGQYTSGMLPAAFSAGNDRFNKNYATAWWGGITGQVTAADPWRFAWDVNYGHMSGNREYLDRHGWYANALIEYKLDWGTPGIYGWYSSGDDDNPNNGSERMPFISQVNVGGDSISTFGFRASPWVNNEGILGGNTVGLWGVGARIKNMSFLEDLTHTLRVNYFGGTNDPKMASYITGRRTTDNAGRDVYRRWTDFNSNYGVYLTRADTGLEVNLDSTYKIYENLTLLVELGYIHLWLDNNTWGRYGNLPGNTLHYEDAFKVSVGFMYNF